MRPLSIIFQNDMAIGDWRLGVDTRKIVRLPLHNKTTCFAAESTDYSSAKEIFTRLNVQENDVFLDIGAGTGRAVIIAATYPFRQVIGVELSADLSVIAKKNLVKAAKRLKCRDVRIVRENASHYIIPPEVTVVYFFSPFGEELIRQVLTNIEKSLSQNPRNLTVVYCNPRIFEEVVTDFPWLIKKWEFQRYDGIRFVAYGAGPTYD